MSATITRSASQSATLTKVVYVTRKVQADLFALVDTYAQISVDYAIDLIHDLRLLLDEEVLDRIDFLWTRPWTNQVVGAYSYTVLSGGVGLVDDRAGGIRYDPTLQRSEFSVRIYFNSRWYSLSDQEKWAIKSRCRLSWGAGQSLDYSQGTWSPERGYAKDDLGLGRGRFTGW